MAKLIVAVEYPNDATNVGVDVTCNRYTQFSKCCGPLPWTKNVTFTSANHYIRPGKYTVTFALSGNNSSAYNLSKTSMLVTIRRGRTARINVSLTKSSQAVIDVVVRVVGGAGGFIVSALLNGVTKQAQPNFQTTSEQVFRLSWLVPPKSKNADPSYYTYTADLSISGESANLYKFLKHFTGRPMESRSGVSSSVVAGGVYVIDDVSTKIAVR